MQPVPKESTDGGAGISSKGILCFIAQSYIASTHKAASISWDLDLFITKNKTSLESSQNKNRSTDFFFPSFPWDTSQIKILKRKYIPPKRFSTEVACVSAKSWTPKRIWWHDYSSWKQTFKTIQSWTELQHCYHEMSTIQHGRKNKN